jgi:hypothetical protein
MTRLRLSLFRAPIAGHFPHLPAAVIGLRLGLALTAAALFVTGAPALAQPDPETVILVRGETVAQLALPPLLAVPGGVLETNDLFVVLFELTFGNDDLLVYQPGISSSFVLGLDSPFVPALGEILYYDPQRGATVRATRLSQSVSLPELQIATDAGGTGSVSDLLAPVGSLLIFGGIPRGGPPGGGPRPPPPDRDHDGVRDTSDNCPDTPNANQSDLDGDGVGDACDLQTCGNGVPEPPEECDGGPTCNASCMAVPRRCDANDDGSVNRTDIDQITAAAGSLASGPDDPRDPDADGAITILDARRCTFDCDRENCELPSGRACGLGAELALLALAPGLVRRWRMRRDRIRARRGENT